MFPTIPMKFIVAGVGFLALCATGLYTFWRIDALTSQLAVAHGTAKAATEANIQNIATIEQLKRDRERITAALATTAAENQRRATALAKTRKRINETNDQSPVAPVVRDAINGLRDGLQAGN
jgi:hypothetical protein